MRATWLCVVLSVVAAPAFAQSATSVIPLPSVFIGAGAGVATNDAENRMRLYEERIATAVIIEAGVALASRVGLGVEYSQPSAATASTTVGLGRFQVTGRQEERVILGLLRGRITGGPRWALDAVGGAGMLFQHHQSGICDPPVTRCEDTSGRSLDERAPALVFGADVPIRVARHFEVAAMVRAYNLRRSLHTHLEVPGVNFQFEWQPSWRTVASVNARVVW